MCTPFIPLFNRVRLPHATVNSFKIVCDIDTVYVSLLWVSNHFWHVECVIADIKLHCVEILCRRIIPVFILNIDWRMIIMLRTV